MIFKFGPFFWFEAWNLKVNLEEIILWVYTFLKQNVLASLKALNVGCKYQFSVPPLCTYPYIELEICWH